MQMAGLAPFPGWLSTCLLAALLLPSPAAAGLVTIQFEGVVEADPPHPIDEFALLPEIEPGDRFTGSYIPGQVKSRVVEVDDTPVLV